MDSTQTSYLQTTKMLLNIAKCLFMIDNHRTNQTKHSNQTEHSVEHVCLVKYAILTVSDFLVL